MSPSDPPPDSTAPNGNPRTNRLLVAGLLAFVILLLAVIVERDRIRTHWWAHRLAAAETLHERAYYLACLASVGNAAQGAVDRLLKDPRPDLQMLAIPASQGMPADLRLDAVLKALMSSDDAEVRHSAATAAAFMNCDAGLRFLIDQSERRDPRIASAAVAGLARVAEPEAVSAICRAMARQNSPAVRAQAIEALSQQLSEAPAAECDPLTALVAALDDYDAFTGLLALELEMQHASEAVAGAGNPVSGPKWSARAGSSPRTVASVAAQLLSTLTGQSIEPSASLDAKAKAELVRECRRLIARRDPAAVHLSLPPGTQPPP